MLYAIFALIVIIVDQWVKFWVASNLVVDTDVLGFIPGFVSLVNVHNEGAAFGFLSGANAKLFLVGLACAFALIVIIGLATRLINGPIGRWSAVLVAAGGLSNAIDRLLYGYVQDMFRFDFVDFAVFNVADIFITVFCIFFIIDLIFGGENGLFGRKREDYDNEVEDEEEEAPIEKPSKKAKKEKKSSRRAAVEDEDDEEEDAPVRRKSAAKKAAPDTDYDEYKSRKKAKPESKSEPETDYAALEAARKAAEQEEAQRRAQQAAAAEAAARQAAEAKAAAAAAAAAAKPAAPVSDDLDLESILNEFK